MTQESLIQRPEGTDSMKPEETTSANSGQDVEPVQILSLMDSLDTSAENIVNWEKRYKDLQSFQSKRENELRGEIKDLKISGDSFELPTTAEELQSFKTAKPDQYNMMVTLARQATTEATQNMSDQLRTLESDRSMNEYNQAQVKIKAAHTDYIEVVNSKDFHTWAEGESQQVQQWIYNNPDNPDLAIIALDRYKAQRDAKTAHPDKATNQPSNTANSAANAVGTPSSAPTTINGKKVWTKSEIDKSDWAKYGEEIEEAFTDGRVNFNA